MFWADRVAKEIIGSGEYKPYWVDDMKTPSGRVHVGALLGVVLHDLVFRALRDAGVDVAYTYVFENHDPMDDIPSYLPREKFEKYLGMPLFSIPSPVEGYSNFAEYYALEFQRAFNEIGSHPKILWTKDLYTSGKMNPGIRTVLDNADEVRRIYAELYKKPIPDDWYPFQVYCESCGKVSTTRVHNWDGELVYYKCPADATPWTKGCGHTGKTSPFSDESSMKGKMPWKVEWAAKWQAIGVTVEGAGKDHMSRGGSHDLASMVARRVLQYPVPYPVGYEFMLIGGKKMSSSKGRGFAAADMTSILPPELVRFLIVKMDIKKQTNFDPTDPEVIPKLFDEYQRYAEAYFVKTGDLDSIGDDDLARVFELSQINDIKKPPSVRFSLLTKWVQMPNMQTRIEEEGLSEWAKYARIWVEQFASDSERFIVQKELPDAARNLSSQQQAFLKKVGEELENDWEAEDFQKELYEWGKALDVSSKDAFSAIYHSLLGKSHGPKAGWLILSLDKEFVKKRFEEVSGLNHEGGIMNRREKDTSLLIMDSHIKPSTFSIDARVKKKFSSISIGIATIKGVKIAKSDPELEKEKEAFLQSLGGLTTEELGKYPEVISYRKLYKEMGIDWHSRRPSPEALLRRVALKKGLYTVNSCVDAYNLTVMKSRVSVGAFDLAKISFPTVLRFAKAGEKILLLGDQEPTAYTEKELAYFDQNGGYNIDFNYRDAQRTAVRLETTDLYINVDAVYDIPALKIEQVLKESCDMIIKYCGGKIEEFGVLATH